MFPIGLHAWNHVLGMPTAHQLQAQIIYRAKKVLEFGPITPAHRKPPWPGYKQSLRFFTKLLAEHPLVGICRPSNPLPAETLKAAGHMRGSIYIRGAGRIPEHWRKNSTDGHSISTCSSHKQCCRITGKCTLSTTQMIDCAFGTLPGMTWDCFNNRGSRSRTSQDGGPIWGMHSTTMHTGCESVYPKAAMI